jgi:uncharacterized protein YdeI (BOF family)
MGVDRLSFKQRGLTEMSTPETPASSMPPPEPPTRFSPFRSGKRSPALFATLLVAFAIGGGVTAATLQARRPSLVMLTPAPITSMHDWSEVAVKGQVADVFGNKFIVQDDSGRALVDSGRAGESGKLVAKSENVTVQGRFEHGFIHAEVISHPDGRNDFVGPPGPPPPPGGAMALRGPGGPPAPDVR